MFSFFKEFRTALAEYFAEQALEKAYEHASSPRITKLDQTLLYKLATHEDVNVRVRLASNPHLLWEDYLEILAKDTNVLVRKALIDRMSLSPNALQILAQDQVEEIKNRALKKIAILASAPTSERGRRIEEARYQG